jgi:hypothetical protein
MRAPSASDGAAVASYSLALGARMTAILAGFGLGAARDRKRMEPAFAVAVSSVPRHNHSTTGEGLA